MPLPLWSRVLELHFGELFSKAGAFIDLGPRQAEALAGLHNPLHSPYHSHPLLQHFSNGQGEASWLLSEGFFLSMSTCAKSVLMAVPLPTHVCPGGCRSPHACPGGCSRGCCCSHTCPCPRCPCTVCRMYSGGDADVGMLSCLCVGGSRPGRFFVFWVVLRVFSPPSPGSPFSRDLYPALIKRSAVCAVLSGVSASCVGAGWARPGLGKRGADRDRRERPRSAPGTGLPRRPPVCAAAAGEAG